MRRPHGRGHVPSPRRVVVASPQTQLALARRGRGTRKVVLPHDIDTAAVRLVYIRQRRLALLSTAALVLLVFGLPLLLAVRSDLGQIRLGDVPASWLLLGAAPYPPLLAGAWIHLRAAERIERLERVEGCDREEADFR